MKRKGFTLAELILSIGMISISGVVAVSLFLTADALNRKAADLDRCVFLSTGIAEAVRGNNRPEDLAEEPVMADARITRDKRNWEFHLLFDEDWRPLPADGPDTSDALVSVTVSLFPDPVQATAGGTGISCGEVWQLRVVCIRTKRYTTWSGAEEKPELFALSTAVFYSDVCHADRPAGGE